MGHGSHLTQPDAEEGEAERQASFPRGLNQGQAGFHQCGVRVGRKEGDGVQADEPCVKSRSKREPGTFKEVQVIGPGTGGEAREAGEAAI